MEATRTPSWAQENQRALQAALASVRWALQRAVGEAGVGMADDSEREVEFAGGALDRLCSAFNLTTFERDVLLLCAGVELDSSFGQLCAAANGDPSASFSLALAVFPDAHWSALSPASPLRYWRLITLESGHALVRSPLQIDERILHYLMGVRYIDDRLTGMVKPVIGASPLVPSHQALAERLADLWSGEAADWPVLELVGQAESSTKRAAAARVCALVNLPASVISTHVLPLDSREMDGFIRLWEREVALGGAALILDAEDDSGDPARDKAAAHLVEQLRAPLIVTSSERLRSVRRPLVMVEIGKPTAAEQLDLWRDALATLPQDENVEALVGQFDMDAPTIAAVRQALSGQPGLSQPDHRVWDACRLQARPRMTDLAQHIETQSTWEDLVLPEQQRQTLRTIATQVRLRLQVYETWGFAEKSNRGLGISALFAGASGTGKTLAAEVIANELRLDLYRIDLSSVVSKYIGETEKNLRRVFDAAEIGGAILLFDEADALFGKRSEVKDSHDRYANIEVSYLLQRMESYRGLAILTSNMKNALDTAFLRRIRFIVQFPFPDTAQRAAIWERAFPQDAPTEGLDPVRLSQLNVAGGNIRNIALNAAFLAAGAGEPVRMSHVLAAARGEYLKLEKTVSEAEIRGWV